MFPADAFFFFSAQQSVPFFVVLPPRGPVLLRSLVSHLDTNLVGGRNSPAQRDKLEALYHTESAANVGIPPFAFMFGYQSKGRGGSLPVEERNPIYG